MMTMYSCPKCGQVFDRAQLARIAKSARWTHVLILTGLVGLPVGLFAGIAAANSLNLVPPTKGIVALGVAALLTGAVGVLFRAYDRRRYGGSPP
jgi:hypothetical protein